MGERRPHFGPFNQQPSHGSNVRGGRPIPRRPDWQRRAEQANRDKAALRQAVRERAASSKKETLGVGNQELPAFKHKHDIVDYVEHYKAIILGGPTGSGKSTQVPQFLYEAGFDKTYLLVPRRIIADGLVDRLRDELADHIGADTAERVVGVVHGERADFSDDNKITIMTPNTFTRMEPTIRQNYREQKVAIIPDEIHEANIYTEIATGVAAQAVDENPDWHLVLSSATHNKETLHDIVSKLNDGVEPVIEIEGRPYQIEQQEAADETPMEVYARMGHDHAKTMIFTSGKKEIDHVIDETRRILDERQPGLSQRVVFRKLHGELTEYELSHINDPITEDKRLVIVSSPAGMSGITIPDVTLSIVDGTINRPELDEELSTGLSRSYLSQAEITQMFGRAGRNVSGGIGVLAKPIAVEEDKLRARHKDVEVEQMPFVPFAERASYGPPEIYHTNLSGVVLSVAALDRHFADINPYIPHPVDDLPIIQAAESLERLGAFEDEKITPTGRMMSQFPIRPELSRGLVEALGHKRSLQHMAQLAIIAASLEAGGVQEFTRQSGREWEKLLRPSTSDDAIAQLDIMSQFPNVFDKHEDIRGVQPYIGGEQLDFLRHYDLSYKRMQQTRKVTGKILQQLGIRQANLLLETPSYDDEQLLRDDLTAGMIDSVYRKARVEHRRQFYQNIHGDEDAKLRYISDRSVVTKNEHDYVAGFARWFKTNKRDGSQEYHNVIELLYPVRPEVVGAYALQNHLLTKKSLESTFRDGEVVGRHQPMFGSIPVGRAAEGHASLQISEADRRLLTRKVFEAKSGYALTALLDLASELETYTNRLPADELQALQYERAPAMLTKATVERLVYEATAHTNRVSEVDVLLQQYIYEENIAITRYFSEEAREEIALRTPDEIAIGDSFFRVHYDKGQAYMTLPSTPEQQALVLSEPHFLPDGREIMIQQPRAAGGTERISLQNR